MPVIKTSFKTLLLSCLLGLLAAGSSLAQYVAVAPSSLTFNFSVGGALPAFQTATLSSYTDATLATAGAPVLVTSATISYTSGTPGWLFIVPIPPSVATPAPINVYPNAAVLSTLPVGAYAASITFTYDGTANPLSQSTVTIFLIVGAAGSGGGGGGGGTLPTAETITVAPTSLSFSYNVGASVPASQPLAVSTSDNAAYSASALTNDGRQWLLLNPATGATPGTINVSVNPVGLNPGPYSGTITVSGPNSVTTVPVSLTVGGGGLTLSPTSLTFNVPQNYGFGAPQYIQVTSSAGAATFTASGYSDSNWLVVDTPSGTTPGAVTVRVNDSSLLQGTYSGYVTVQTSPSNATQVPVTLTVGAPAAFQIAPSSMSFSYSIGNAVPAAQIVNVKSLTSAVQTFSTVTSTTDGAPWLLATANGPTPGTVSVSISPGTLVPGTYNGVVNITPATAAASPQPVLVSLTVLPAPTPVVVSVNSSASYATGVVAPGEFVTLFGSSLGPANLTTPTPGTAPTNLGGTTITFDGIAAPILYASATQTSVQVPYGINLPTTVMQVQRNGATSKATQINSVPAYPTLFTADSSGKGQIAALNYPSYTPNSPSNPATRGGLIIIYGTGEGRTNPTSVEGTITTSILPLPQPLYAVSVTIGGIPATIAYAGETPTALAGLMQINVTIPANAPVGSGVPVLVTINGQTSQGGATITVQ